MRVGFKAALLTLGAVLALFASTAAPASAAVHNQGTLAFEAQVHLGCFGCGNQTGGVANGTASGQVNGTPLVLAALAANFNYQEPASTCPALGNAQGNFTVGAGYGTFTWVRVGANAVLTVSGVNGYGEVNGAGDGVAAFAVTAPVGDPCGQPVTAEAAGSVVLTS